MEFTIFVPQTGSSLFRGHLIRGSAIGRSLRRLISQRQLARARFRRDRKDRQTWRKPFVGGGIYSDGDLSLSYSTVSGNSASFRGGGLHIGVDAVVSLDVSTVAGNSATRTTA